jgi:ribonuclease BN (tRNA processing enzyme)
MITITRRRLLAATALAAVSRAATAQTQAAKRSRLILLGSGGGSRMSTGRSMAGQLLLVGDVPYVIDCGYGTTRQIAAAGVLLPTVRHTFLTRQVAETNADFINLLTFAWIAGLSEALDNWGPPPLKRMVDLALEANAEDLKARATNEGRPVIQRPVWVHEITADGPVMRDDRVQVTAATVGAPSASPALAFRFDMADRSVVFASLAKPAEKLIDLARGADLLIHPAYYAPALEQIVAYPVNRFPNRQNPNLAMVREHFLATASSAEDAGRTARAAGVKALVLAQLQPSSDRSITDKMWTDAARSTFPGRIIVARDLLEL